MNKFSDGLASGQVQFSLVAFASYGDVLQPLDPDRGPIAKEEVGRIFERINDATETLCTTYADTLPADCARAPVHLQMVSLALSAQEVL